MCQTLLLLRSRRLSYSYPHICTFIEHAIIPNWRITRAKAVKRYSIRLDKLAAVSLLSHVRIAYIRTIGNHSSWQCHGVCKHSRTCSLVSLSLSLPFPASPFYLSLSQSRFEVTRVHGGRKGGGGGDGDGGGGGGVDFRSGMW